MEKRKCGNTDLELSLLGFGGFHLLETSMKEAGELLNFYLDLGGNYIETAYGYGEGNSEKKVGTSLSARRKDFVLATKCYTRDYQGTIDQVEKSLDNLKTDCVDILFMHGINGFEEVDKILSDDGAVKAAEKLRDQGKVKYIGVTGHGQPDALVKVIPKYNFDVMMTGFNYYDRCNFPDAEDKLIPLCRERGTGILAMKGVADGYLYRSWEQAIRYSLSLPVSCLVMGMNRKEFIKKDMEMAENFKPMSDKEKGRLFKDAPELGNYICRQCGKCRTDDFDPAVYFFLEGLFDRQMDDRTVPDTAQFALRERLRFWFGQAGRAKEEYAAMDAKIDPQKNYSEYSSRCPYGIDIDRKMKIVHEKLSGEYIY